MKPSPRPWKNPFSAIITHYSSSSSTQELPATATEKRDNPPKKFQHIAWNTVYAYFEEKVQFDEIHVFFMVIPKGPNENSGLYWSVAYPYISPGFF